MRWAARRAARQIAARGTSANRQKEVFAAARKSGADVREALRQVVDWLSETTSPKD
jgi:carboxylate-amine ligase